MARLQLLEDSTTEKISARFSRRPTSATVVIYGDGGSTLVTSTAATLGAATTVAAASGLGQSDRRLITLTAITSLKYLGNYIVRNAALQQEAVQLISVPSSKICSTAEPLRYAYAAADVFEDPEVSYTALATTTVNSGVNFRARFTGTMADATVEVRDVVFDVVKHKIYPPIDATNLSQHDPMLLEMVPHSERGTDWATMLDAAWNSVYQDLITQEVLPDRYLDAERLARLQLYQLKIILSESGLKLAQEEYPFQSAKYFRGVYQTLLTECSSKASWYDSSNDLVPGGAAEQMPVQRSRVL
jgi:hypothetical protein